jgi:adenylate cyclase
VVEFASVVDAVRCAVEVQRAMPERNNSFGAESRIELRIGINLGDVILEGDDLYGDGVNIAARIEALADAGGVFVSNTVHDQVRDRLPCVFKDPGEQRVMKIARPIRVYRIDIGAAVKGVAAVAAPALPLPDTPSIVVLPFQNMNGDGIGEISRSPTEAVAEFHITVASANSREEGRRSGRTLSRCRSRWYSRVRQPERQ